MKAPTFPAMPPVILALLCLCSCRGPEPSAAVDHSASVRPGQLRCEYLHDPLGIDEARPRLSWILEPLSPASRGKHQTAYRVLVASSPGVLLNDTGDLWDSGKVESQQSIHVAYAGRPLTSVERCHWKVKVWDAKGRPSSWSPVALWSMGLLEPGDWRGKWIGLDGGDEAAGASPLKGARWIWFAEGSPAERAPIGTRYFRTTFDVPGARKVTRALCTITADNDFTLFVNGKRAGAGSSFQQAFEIDISEHLKEGENTVAVSAGNVGDAPNPAGLIGILRVEFGEGPALALSTDEAWKSAPAAAAGWESPGFNDSAWSKAAVLGEHGMKPWGDVGRSDFRRLPARLLRTEFDVKGRARRATAYFCGLGLSELEINGSKIGDHVLSPALSEYDKRCLYVTFDVTNHIVDGRNAVGIHLGNGRYYAPRLAVPTTTRTYGYPKAILELRIECADGSTMLVTTSESWKITTGGPIRANSEYDGEEYDARLEVPGWSSPGFNDSSWSRAEVVAAPAGVLRSQNVEPIRVMETIKPVSLSSPRPGVHIFDMGQNMVGWCRLTVSGPRGTTVSLRHSEVLKPDGTLYLDNIRSARVTDLYTLKGEGVETWEPRFTYHGFRYVEMRGFPGEPTPSVIEGRVVHDAMEKAGEFTCSNSLLNRIHSSIFWGVRGNYRSIPTDCPQRDERQGWLGDRSAESRGESCLFNVAAFYSKWMQDIEDSQKDTGSVPDVAPPYWPIYSDNVTWPASCVIIPGAIHLQYADVRIFERRYVTMKKWVDFMAGFIKDDLMPRDTYGDWCVPPEEQHLIHSGDPLRKTPGEVIATAYFYHVLRLMGSYAELLGKPEDAGRFSALAERLKAAFNAKYLDEKEGRYANGSQTSSVLPLAFGMVPGQARERVFSRLVEKIVTEGKGHIGTGLIGGQWLMRVLSDNGRPDVAYGMASKADYPSWGYMIEKGATTVWELWNGDTADPAMNSGNHVMLVGDLLIWLYEYLGGIRPDPKNPGFKHIIIRPVPTGDLEFVRVSRMSPYGRISTSWQLRDGIFRLEVEIPPNTTATVCVPAKDVESVTEGWTPAAKAQGVAFLRFEESLALYEVGSGTYAFVSASPPL